MSEAIPPAAERFEEALVFAARLHRAQVRKGTGVPYISHLLAVAALVMEHGGNGDEAVAALLHDAIEDQGQTYQGGRAGIRAAIRGRFGDRVLAIVDACTDDEGHEKGKASGEAEEAARWRRRKEAYIAHLERCGDPGVLRVSCADKLHNARTLLADYRTDGLALWQRFRVKRREDHLWYYRELARVLKGRAGRLADELVWSVAQLEYISGGRAEPAV